MHWQGGHSGSLGVDSAAHLEARGLALGWLAAVAAYDIRRSRFDA
jgi:hypothetical protein